jgi:hypothetical protein
MPGRTTALESRDCGAAAGSWPADGGAMTSSVCTIRINAGTVFNVSSREHRNNRLRSVIDRCQDQVHEDGRLPVSKRALEGMQYRIGDAALTGVVDNMAAIVAELDRRFVPAIAAAAGPAPEWFTPGRMNLVG